MLLRRRADAQVRSGQLRMTNLLDSRGFAGDGKKGIAKSFNSRDK